MAAVLTLESYLQYLRTNQQLWSRKKLLHIHCGDFRFFRPFHGPENVSERCNSGSVSLAPFHKHSLSCCSPIQSKIIDLGAVEFESSPQLFPSVSGI